MTSPTPTDLDARLETALAPDPAVAARIARDALAAPARTRPGRAATSLAWSAAALVVVAVAAGFFVRGAGRTATGQPIRIFNQGEIVTTVSSSGSRLVAGALRPPRPGRRLLVARPPHGETP